MVKTCGIMLARKLDQTSIAIITRVRCASDIFALFQITHGGLAMKTALVTGASRGIGEAIARELSKNGFKFMSITITASKRLLLWLQPSAVLP